MGEVKYVLAARKVQRAFDTHPAHSPVFRSIGEHIAFSFELALD